MDLFRSAAPISTEFCQSALGNLVEWSKLPGAGIGGNNIKLAFLFRATGVAHDLRLLVGAWSSGGIDDETTGLQSVLANVDLGLLAENVATKGTGIHGRVKLLAISYQGVTR